MNPAPRDPALEVALASKESLQKSLSAAKHGGELLTRRAPLSVRDILNGGSGRVRTICVHNTTNSLAVECLWHSLCKVSPRDLDCRIEKSESCYILRLKATRLYLYSISMKDLAASVREICSDVLDVDDQSSTCGDIVIRVRNIPPNWMICELRSSVIECKAGDWTVMGATGTIYTIFKGEKFKVLMPYCSEILSTNSRVMVEYLGKIKTCIMYRKYAEGLDVDLYISRLLCTLPNEVYDYKSMATKDPVKRLTIRDQMGSIANMIDSKAVDLLSCNESKLFSGRNLS
jgi:hypothetical protein